jgi:hypothetical protein
MLPEKQWVQLAVTLAVAGQLAEACVGSGQAACSDIGNVKLPCARDVFLREEIGLSATW